MEKESKDSKDSSERYTLHSVATAFKILDLFFEHEELSPAEVARLMEISRSTAFRFLVTLDQCGYLTKTENAGYRLGIKITSLGQVAHNRQALISLVHPYLLKLSENSGESSHLAIMDTNTHVTFIDKAIGTLWLKMDVMIGYNQYAHLTATGKAIMAYESDQFINQYIRTAVFDQHTSHSIKDAGELLRILDQIKEQGYALDNEETELGLFCIAKPILSNTGTPLAAISISGPASRMKVNMESHLELLQAAVEQIQKSL